MTPERLQELKELCEKASPGPWDDEISSTDCGSFEYSTGPWHDQRGGDTDFAKRDAVFIATARTALPELIAEVDNLQHYIHRLIENEMTHTGLILEQMDEIKGLKLALSVYKASYPNSDW